MRRLLGAGDVVAATQAFDRTHQMQEAMAINDLLASY